MSNTGPAIDSTFTKRKGKKTLTVAERVQKKRKLITDIPSTTSLSRSDSQTEEIISPPDNIVAYKRKSVKILTGKDRMKNLRASQAEIIIPTPIAILPCNSTTNKRKTAKTSTSTERMQKQRKKVAENTNPSQISSQSSKILSDDLSIPLNIFEDWPVNPPRLISNSSSKNNSVSDKLIVKIANVGIISGTNKMTILKKNLLAMSLVIPVQFVIVYGLPKT